MYYVAAAAKKNVQKIKSCILIIGLGQCQVKKLEGLGKPFLKGTHFELSRYPRKRRSGLITKHKDVASTARLKRRAHGAE